jgi:hypothetical protein
MDHKCFCDLYGIYKDFSLCTKWLEHMTIFKKVHKYYLATKSFKKRSGWIKQGFQRVTTRFGNYK